MEKEDYINWNFDINDTNENEADNIGKKIENPIIQKKFDGIKKIFDDEEA